MCYFYFVLIDISKHGIKLKVNFLYPSKTLSIFKYILPLLTANYITINYKYIQLHSKFNYPLFFLFLVKVPQQQQRLAKVKSQVKKNKPAQYNMHIHKRNYKCPCNRYWQLKEIYLVQGGSKDLSSFNDIPKSSNIEN